MKLLSLLSCHHHQSFVLITFCKRCINFKEIKNTKFSKKRQKNSEKTTIQQENKKRKKAPTNHGMMRKEQHRDEDLCVSYTLTILKVSVAELRSSHMLLGECTLHVFCHMRRKKAYYETAKHNTFITQKQFLKEQIFTFHQYIYLYNCYTHPSMCPNWAF